MTEISAGTLLPSERMRSQAVDGDVTQIHRGQAYAEVGDAFEAVYHRFERVE